MSPIETNPYYLESMPQDMVALLAGLLVFGWWLVDWVRYTLHNVLYILASFIVISMIKHPSIWAM